MRSRAPLSRRRLLGAGGMVAAGLLLPRGLWAEGDAVEIRMAGRPDGSHVWFDPVGLLVRPGQPVRWVNADPSNAHTSTAYHPDHGGRPRRIPRAAEPWDSGYLLPGESFEVRLTAEGVYDYLCIPHERAGMVGRLVVLAPGSSLDEEAELGRMEDAGLPAAATFPSIADILAHGRVGPS